MDLITEQARLEKEMVSSGIDLFRNRHSTAMSSDQGTRSPLLREVLYSLVEPTAVEIAALMAGNTRLGSRGPVVGVIKSLKHLEGLDPEALAFLACRTLVDRVGEIRSWAHLSRAIGNVVEIEARMAAFQQVNPDIALAVQRDLDTRTQNTVHRMRVVKHTLTNHPDDDPGAWGSRDVLTIGSRLLDIAVRCSAGLFEIQRHSAKGQRGVSVIPSRRFQDWLASLALQMEALHPVFSPTVIPPKDWTGLYGGGYHTDALVYPLTMVKTRSKAHRKALEGADLTEPMKAMNAVQRTPWAVQKDTLAIVLQLVEQGGGVAGIPSMEDEHLPTKPLDIATDEANRKDWRTRAAAVYDNNRKLLSKRLAALRVASYANKFAQYDAIYFPQQLDFRGRMYSVPQLLNPQGTDLAKGLLVFAEGDPVVYGEASHEWLCVHGANCFGLDKASFEERVAWVKAHIKEIVQTTFDPMAMIDWWGNADSPFCFLTWCFEFKKWHRDFNYKPRVPIAMDGTCNGIQHYSALLRDPVAGRSVNLVPADKPQDIYRTVADHAMGTMRDTLVAPVDPKQPQNRASAKKWLELGIDRSITKRPVMVLPYGGTFNSCANYVREAIAEKWGPDILTNRDAVRFLNSTVWASIGEVVISSRLAMGWIRGVADAVTKAERPLQWTAPSGFVVLQDYKEEAERRINLFLTSGRVQVRFQEDIHSLSRHRQMNGAPPNFVHSLDAAALVATVNRASDAGLTKFAVIHDSFGTTAGLADVLAKITREAFVHQYENYDLNKFGYENGWIGDDAPFVGGLDLSEVLNSKYFFA